MEFDSFGRRAGFRLVMAGDRSGWSYLVNPVSIVRYWEFSFAAAQLPKGIRMVADISSPRLFSFWVESQYPDVTIDLLNPDERDTAGSTEMASALRSTRVHPATASVNELPESAWYDAVWSLSVVEHISGEYSDTDAVMMMWRALRPGGHLILTVPVDRRHRDEFRGSDPYGTQEQRDDGEWFFQRFYDEASLRERLIDPLSDGNLVDQRWFGERDPGHFAAYERDWMRRGLAVTVEDPREIADHFRAYPTWSEMPGIGVCGIHLVRGP